MENEIRPEVTTSAPKILIEILVHGVEDEKKEIKKLFDNIEGQMSKLKKGKMVRILWYIDKGELSKEEKEKWLIENSNCKYHIFLNERTVKPDYIKDLLTIIKKLEDSIKNFKSFGLAFSKKNEIKNEQSNLKIA